MTHGVNWLPKVDKIIVLNNGVISETGSYEELLSHNGIFAQFLKTYLLQEESSDEDEDPERNATLICQHLMMVVVDYYYFLLNI